MVEFDRRKNDGLRKVMQELGAFIEESGIVFVAFNVKCLPWRRAKLLPKFSAIPPTRMTDLTCRLKNPCQHGIVVVLPCVPAITIGCRVRRKRSNRISGMDRKVSAHPEHIPAQDCRAKIALPTITRSGRGFRLVSENGWEIGMEIEARKSDMGGYAAASEP